MKRCPDCGRDYTDDTLLYCLDDGTRLVDGPATEDERKTAILTESNVLAIDTLSSESPTQALNPMAMGESHAAGSRISDQRSKNDNSFRNSIIAGCIGIVLITVLVIGGYWFYRTKSNDPAAQIKSIAVMPFANESGNPDNEYLSDGMTETLITSLSQLSNLNVKARGSVFRYKGKEVEPRKVGLELGVQAILLGRVVQRGNDLTLYIELVDTSSENTLWKADYNRPMTNLVALQNEIARDVSGKLRIRLSGVDEQKLAKNYTANAEAYQLYLKGRYHLLKTTRSEFQTSITYFQQAIAIDPSYALAYTGLADAYRSLSVAGEMPSADVMPQSKLAGQKAIEIDDTLADAHAVLGFTIFWYDWDWEAAENQFKRALELDPNNADAHIFYGHLLSNTGRSREALVEGKRAREIDPLNLRTNALDSQFLLHAGQVDEALARLQKTSALEPNYWL
ncbi:MAG: tetratricopeptide repeat protein, partial [Pyrinomonadaceae bacterium]